MKNVKYTLAIVFMVVIFAGSAMADTITGITLWGGNDGTNWVSNGQAWSATNNGFWPLGVSSAPNGTLVNQSGTTISVPFDQHYWLYAEPTSLGSTPKIEVITEKGMLTTIFTLSGTAGNESPWSILQGSPLLQLGWALGSADKVGTWNQLTPNGNGDFYLHIQAGTPVPLPSALYLLAPGLLGLIGLKRKYLG